MRLIIAVIALFFLSSAFAAERKEVYALNGAGQLLTLTNEVCDFADALPGVKLWVAETEFPDGTIVKGCWIFAEDAPAVIVYWENGYKSVLTDSAAFSTVKPQREPKQEYF